MTGLDLIALLSVRPALLVTADTGPALMSRARDLGVNVLHKPVPAQKLRDAVRQALGGASL
jgi:hypothetical protein